MEKNRVVPNIDFRRHCSLVVLVVVLVGNLTRESSVNRVVCIRISPQLGRRWVIR